MGQHLNHWAEISDRWVAIEGFLDHIAEKYGLQLDFASANPGTPLEVRKLIDEYMDVNRSLLEQERAALIQSLRELRGQGG